jgi:hypothetical protein
MNLSVSFTQRAPFSVQLLSRKEGSSVVQLSSRTTKTLVLNAGVRGVKGARGDTGIALVALPDDAGIDGGFF